MKFSHTREQSADEVVPKGTSVSSGTGHWNCEQALEM
jgi:hypothetical protein